MRFHFRFLVLLGCALFLNSALAGGMALKDRDCAEILKRWAADPASVPKSLVDACQEKLVEALPDMNPAAGSPVDPCADPNAANSIYCWGPWASLAPAAGGTVAPIKLAQGDPNLRPDEFTRDPAGDGVTLPLGSCTPGAACGFATIAPGLAAQPADTSGSSVVPYAMNPDASQFVVDPGGSNELVSIDNLQREDVPGPPRYNGIVEGTESKLIVFKGQPDTEGNFDRAGGVWLHGSTTNQTLDNTNSGVFAWGIASSMDTLDTLNAGNVTASFSGNMSGNTGTMANITVNFGSQPGWTGNWQNPGYAFDAGGPVQAVDLVSDPGQFSANVTSGYVQGVLLGGAGNQSVAHAVDVVLDTGGGNELTVRDVGLLPQLPAVQ
ncbi:MAG: hypothetical protein WBQ78_02440 [Gammaproteobacteria bacterium]